MHCARTQKKTRAKFIKNVLKAVRKLFVLKKREKMRKSFCTQKSKTNQTQSKMNESSQIGYDIKKSLKITLKSSIKKLI
jgi:hypothetical protein